jgi:hypothetical protein
MGKKATRLRRMFTPQFKKDAVLLVTEEGKRVRSLISDGHIAVTARRLKCACPRIVSGRFSSSGGEPGSAPRRADRPHRPDSPTNRRRTRGLASCGLQTRCSCCEPQFLRG